jgi:hypothetical protein
MLIAVPAIPGGPSITGLSMPIRTSASPPAALL